MRVSWHQWQSLPAILPFSHLPYLKPPLVLQEMQKWGDQCDEPHRLIPVSNERLEAWFSSIPLLLTVELF
jgi:hypothetical protein